MNDRDETAPVPYFRPDIQQPEIDLVTESLKSGWLTSGPMVKQFESEFAQAVGADYAVALNSATAALHLALLACGVGAGDEVIVPTMTFAATAEVVLAVGATPVLADVDADTLLIDLGSVANAITDKTRAVMPVHYGGTVADMDGLAALAATHNLAIVEDAAHAFPSRQNGKMVGSIGTATCFSFYANKTLTTGEGGMLTTNDSGIADVVRQLSLHGLSRDAWARFEVASSWDYDIVKPGWKYNMTDAAAALGIGQLARAHGFADRRRQIHAIYDAAFKDHPRLTPRQAGPLEDQSSHLYVLRFDGKRNELINELGKVGIGTSVHYRPLHMHTLYVEAGYEAESLPVATKAFDQILSLPIFPAMTDAEVERVIEVVSDLANKQ